jgi:hypothetical protein
VLRKVRVGLIALRKALAALPDILLFADEALFLKSIRTDQMNSQDEQLLGARMREIAHVLEKDLYIHKDGRFSDRRRGLRDMIAVWRERFPPDETTFVWCVSILKMHEKEFRTDQDAST